MNKFEKRLKLVVAISLIGFVTMVCIRSNAFYRYNVSYIKSPNSISKEISVNEKILNSKIFEMNFKNEYDSFARLINLENNDLVNSIGVSFVNSIEELNPAVPTKTITKGETEPKPQVDNKDKYISSFNIMFYKEVEGYYRSNNAGIYKTILKPGNIIKNQLQDYQKNNFLKITNTSIYDGNPVIKVADLSMRYLVKDSKISNLQGFNLEVLDYLKNGVEKGSLQSIGFKAYPHNNQNIKYLEISNEGCNFLNEPDSFEIKEGVFVLRMQINYPRTQSNDQFGNNLIILYSGK